MPRESRITYNPKLSVVENAKKCGVSVAAIRYYIKTRGIDRRYEGKVKVLEGMKAYLAEHPNATRAELQRATGHGINTVRRYFGRCLFLLKFYLENIISYCCWTDIFCGSCQIR